MRIQALFVALIPIFGSAAAEENEDKTHQIFSRSLSCAHRMWPSEDSDLRSLKTHPIYFLDVEAKKVCLEAGYGCKPVSSRIFKDPGFQQALEGFSGYSRYFSSGTGQEHLILNASRSDFKKRASEQNAEIIAHLEKRYFQCRDHASERTVPMKAPHKYFEAIFSLEGVSGFVMHEHFHMFQRTWGPLPTYGISARVADEERFVALLERFVFHLMSLNRLLLTNSSDAPRAFSAARHYFEQLQTDHWTQLSEIDNREEGTAAYVDARAQALWRLGCDAAEHEIQENVFEILNSTTAVHGIRSPYSLTPLAAQALALLQKPQWERRTAKGEGTPVEILFSEGPSARDPGDLDEGKALVRCLVVSD
ncbi:MAG: hypothetical protein AB7G93_04335 [Bdellovibrionales bacterium]